MKATDENNAKDVKPKEHTHSVRPLEPHKKNRSVAIIRAICALVNTTETPIRWDGTHHGMLVGSVLWAHPISSTIVSTKPLRRKPAIPMALYHLAVLVCVAIPSLLFSAAVTMFLVTPIPSLSRVAESECATRGQLDCG